MGLPRCSNSAKLRTAEKAGRGLYRGSRASEIVRGRGTRDSNNSGCCCTGESESGARSHPSRLHPSYVYLNPSYLHPFTFGGGGGSTRRSVCMVREWCADPLPPAHSLAVDRYGGNALSLALHEIVDIERSWEQVKQTKMQTFKNVHAADTLLIDTGNIIKCKQLTKQLFDSLEDEETQIYVIAQLGLWIKSLSENSEQNG
ncbi:hypothetical protein BIW11_02540 [Tropilaelaps mercedesae]|uniref:Uncharacterized protein n=1 Tax=Tropilaelaps mercedesae TaxID=418985 RepID=A0A1V9Y1K5_9ACAR|nr:hypothetical protein BIW11_02540 [Tropilaelaps mercedesae]